MTSVKSFKSGGKGVHETQFREVQSVWFIHDLKNEP
jgi:hypothetical protein